MWRWRLKGEAKIISNEIYAGNEGSFIQRMLTSEQCLKLVRKTGPNWSKTMKNRFQPQNSCILSLILCAEFH